MTGAPSRTGIYDVLASLATQAMVKISNSTLPTIARKPAETLGMEAALTGHQVSLAATAATDGAPSVLARRSAVRHAA